MKHLLILGAILLSGCRLVEEKRNCLTLHMESKDTWIAVWHINILDDKGNSLLPAWAMADSIYVQNGGLASFNIFSQTNTVLWNSGRYSATILIGDFGQRWSRMEITMESSGGVIDFGGDVVPKQANLHNGADLVELLPIKEK